MKLFSDISSTGCGGDFQGQAGSTARERPVQVSLKRSWESMPHSPHLLKLKEKTWCDLVTDAASGVGGKSRTCKRDQAVQCMEDPYVGDWWRKASFECNVME